MPVQQLRLYDILVDVIPGITSLILILFLLPKKVVNFVLTLPVGLASAVVLLVVGFVLGRIFHYLSGKASDYIAIPVYRLIFLLQDDSNPRGKKWHHFLMNLQSQHRSIMIYLRKCLPVEVEENFLDPVIMDAQDAEPVIDGEVYQINREVAKKLATTFYQEKELEPRPQVVRRYGFSSLYGKRTLYQRYNMLTTFFRNISFIFWTFSVIMFIQLVLVELGISIGASSYWLLIGHESIISIGILFLGVIFSRQLYEFSQKRNRHFIFDYLQYLEKES